MRNSWYDFIVKIVFSWHVLNDTIPKFKLLGWNITKAKIRQTIKRPKWTGITKYGQPAAMSLMDERYILRVVFKREGDIITVITVYIARRGKYESTKND